MHLDASSLDISYKLLKATFTDFGGRYTGVYTIYNWYPSVVVKSVQDGMEQPPQSGSPYFVNVSQADADVTVSCNTPSINNKMVEDLGKDAFDFSTWQTINSVPKPSPDVKPTWGKYATVTTIMTEDEDHNRVPKYPNSSLTLRATRKRVADVSAASVEYKEKETKLYTYKWYIGGNSHSKPLSSDNECDKGTKADTSTGECKDKNRIAVSDYIMNASTIGSSNIDKYTIKLYESGSNNTNAPTKKPTGKPLATLGNGVTENDYMKFNGKTLYLIRGELKDRQVYTIAVESPKGSTTINGETFSWGAPTVYYYVYNLYNSKFNNQIASEANGVDVSKSDGVYNVVLDKDSEIYVKSFYSAIYKTGNFSPPDAFTFKKGARETNDYSRLIVNAKDNDTRNSKGKNGSKETDTSNYFHAIIKSKDATFSGVDRSITVVHPEFANRAKTTKIKLYKKFKKTVHVTELHSITINQDTKDDEGNTIGSLKNCKLRMHVIDSNNNAEANEKDWAYKNSGKEVKEKTSLYNWNSTQTPADDADSEEGICRSNKFVHSAKNENGIINIVTKAYFEDANGNNSPCLIDVVNGDRLLGTITVYTEPFIAKNFVRYYDNVGYGELNPDGDSKTKDEYIYVETSRVMQGDSFYVLCNSDNVEYSAKVTGKGANNVNVVKKDVGEGEIAKYRILGPKGRSDITKVDTTFAKGCRYSIEAKTWHDTWSVIENMPNLILSVTVTDKGVAEDYAKDNTTTLLSEIRAIPHSGIINHIWEYNVVNPKYVIGEYIWGSTKYNNNNFADFLYDSNINNSDFRCYSSIHVDLNNFSNFTMDPPDGRELYATHYTFPDLLDSRTPYACAAGTLVDSSDSSASDFEVPSDIVQSPLYSSSAPAEHKYLSHLAWSKNENSATLKKHKSAGAIGKDSAEKPVTESLNNGTLERYLVNISSPTETGRTSCLKAGTGLYLKDNALAAFTTENDDGVSKYLYFIVPSDTIYVTYQVVDNSGKQPWRIIKKFNKNDSKPTQSEKLYTNESKRLSGVQYKNGEADNINLSGANLFGYDTYLNFRGNKITANHDSNTYKTMSGTTKNNSVLLYEDLIEMLGQSVRNGTGMSEDAWINRPMLRLNASKLGWLKRDVKYVDVNITVILNDVGYKQITFPYRLMVNNNNQ